MGDRVPVQLPVRDIYLACNQPCRPTQPGHPLVHGVGAMSASRSVVAHCGWEVEAGMVRVWVAGKIV